LTYLALFLCAKLAITVPFLNYTGLHHRFENDEVSAREQAAAPPTYLIAFPLIPIALAIYVSSTRYSDFYHHGFDIIAGAILGIASAWLGFRWYHLPIRRGGGWAWAPRSSDRAFFKGLGVVTYATHKSSVPMARDLANGPAGGVSHGGPTYRQTKDSDESADIELGNLGHSNGYGPVHPSGSSQQPLR